MIGLVRRLHSWAAWGLAASVLLQAYLAGAAMPQLGGNGDFEAHKGVGYSLPGLLALVVILAAVIARLGRTTILLSVGLLVLYIVQTLLPAAKGPVAALHPVNAMVLLVASVWVARRQTQSAPAAVDVPPPAAPPSDPSSQG